MKEKNLKRTLSVLVAIVLAFSSFFSNYSVAYAADSNETTESTTVTAEKELVQCSNDWVIFKYKDSDGIPQFDITYDNKTIEELSNEGKKLQYIVISKIHYKIPDEYIWNDFNNSIIQEEISKYDDTIFIQFKAENLVSNDNNSKISKSDILSLYYDDGEYNPSPYILSIDKGYWEIYDLELASNPNKFNIKIRVNEPLKEVGNLSVTSYSRYIDAQSYLENNPISNMSFENYKETHTIEKKDYIMEYSIISLEVNFLPKFLLSPDYDIYSIYVEYTFFLNGLEGIYSKNTPESVSFFVNTPCETESVLIQSISINSLYSSIKVNHPVGLTAQILPNNATNKKLNWYSSNEAYATVDENGVVTAKSAGAGKTVTITAKATDGSNIVGNYTLSILPEDTLVKTITITAASSSVKAGKTIDLKASINSDATNKSLVWSSSNAKYAIVDKNGKVTTKLAGAGKTVTITAKAKDGSGKIATFKLKINKILVKRIKLKAKKTIKAGKKLKIKLTINSDATNKDIKWSVSNKKYAKINSKGVLTAKKAGKGKTIKVTAKAKDGSGKKTTIKIKIKK